MNNLAKLAHELISKPAPVENQAQILHRLKEQMDRAARENGIILNLLIPVEIETVVAFQKDQQELDKARVEIDQWFRENVAGKANCGCVHHAEDGIPCPHDLALVGIIESV